MDEGQGGSVLLRAASAPSSSSLRRSQLSPIHLSGLKPNYRPTATTGRGMVQAAEIPISSGEWRWSDRSSNGFSRALMSGWLPWAARGPQGWRAWGGHLQPPTCPRLPPAPCSTRWHLSAVMPSVCLSAFACWVMDRQHAAWWRASPGGLGTGPVGLGWGTGPSCTGVTPAAVQ